VQATGPDLFSFVGILVYLVFLAATIWAFYLAYLVTRALQKYLRG
jgi:hypothetical protein